MFCIANICSVREYGMKSQVKSSLNGSELADEVLMLSWSNDFIFSIGTSLELYSSICSEKSKKWTKKSPLSKKK